jgi:hypothetical protein
MKKLNMKKFWSLLLLLVVSAIQAQQAPGESLKGNIPVKNPEVPAPVLEKFTREFPSAQADWSLDGENYKAAFTNPDTRLKQIVIYDRKGNVVRRESELDKMSTPGALNEYYQKTYPDEEFSAWESRDATGVATYYVNRKSEIVRFDHTGKPVTGGKEENPAHKSPK